MRSLPCRPHLQPLCWTREGGQGGHVMEAMGHSSGLGCKTPCDLTGFSIAERVVTWSSCFASGSMYRQEGCWQVCAEHGCGLS